MFKIQMDTIGHLCCRRQYIFADKISLVCSLLALFAVTFGEGGSASNGEPRRKGTINHDYVLIYFLSPIVKISHTLDFATSNFFCRFATFPPLQRRHLPPKEEARRVIFASRQVLSEAVGDDAHAELLKMLAFLRIWRPEKREWYFASKSYI